MKTTADSIQNWINNDSNKEQIEKMFVNNVDFSAHETSIEEIKTEFDFIIEQLNFLIEKDQLDKLTFHKRNAINTMLNNISSQLNQVARNQFQFSSNPTIGNNIFSYIMSLRDLIDPILYLIKGKGASDYVNESKELIKIKKRYAKLVTDIESVESDKEKLITSNENLLKLLDELKSTISTTQTESEKIKSLNNQIQNLYNQITANAEDVESKKVTISALHKSAKELEEIFENSNSTVKKLETDSTKTIQSFIKDKTEFVDTKVSEYDAKTKKIVQDNTTIQSKINTLLEGANAGELYKAFNTRKKDIEGNLNNWFWGIVVINVVLVVFTLLIINGSTKLGISALNPGSMDSAFYLKLFISVPLLFLDYFIIRQYNLRKDLAEKYAFKSVLSLSLLAYNEMMKENIDNPTSLNFISSTVEKIYQSPFNAKDLTKKELEILNKLAEKGLDKIQTVTKIIE